MVGSSAGNVPSRWFAPPNAFFQSSSRTAQLHREVPVPARERAPQSPAQRFEGNSIEEFDPKAREAPEVSVSGGDRRVVLQAEGGQVGVGREVASGTRGEQEVPQDPEMGLFGVQDADRRLGCQAPNPFQGLLDGERPREDPA